MTIDYWLLFIRNPQLFMKKPLLAKIILHRLFPLGVSLVLGIIFVFVFFYGILFIFRNVNLALEELSEDSFGLQFDIQGFEELNLLPKK